MSQAPESGAKAPPKAETDLKLIADMTEIAQRDSDSLY